MKSIFAANMQRSPQSLNPLPHIVKPNPPAVSGNIPQRVSGFGGPFFRTGKIAVPGSAQVFFQAAASIIFDQHLIESRMFPQFESDGITIAVFHDIGDCFLYNGDETVLDLPGDTPDISYSKVTR